MNRLIDALPARYRKRFLAGCERVDLVLNDELCSSGERIKHVYFPAGSFISLIEPVGEHACLEVGLVGDEGMPRTSVTSCATARRCGRP